MNFEEQVCTIQKHNKKSISSLALMFICERPDTYHIRFNEYDISIRIRKNDFEQIYLYFYEDEIVLRSFLNNNFRRTFSTINREFFELFDKV